MSFALTELSVSEPAFKTALQTIDTEFLKYLVDSYALAQETGVTPAAFDAIWQFFLSTFQTRIEVYCRMALYVAMVGIIPTKAAAKKRFGGKDSPAYDKLHGFLEELAARWVEAKDSLQGLPTLEATDANHAVKVARQLTKVMSPIILQARVFLAKRGLAIWKPGVDFGATPDVYKFPEASYMIIHSVPWWGDYKKGYLALLNLSKSYNKSVDSEVVAGIDKFIANNTSRIEGPPPQAAYYKEGIHTDAVKAFAADSDAKAMGGARVSKSDARNLVRPDAAVPVIPLPEKLKGLNASQVKAEGVRLTNYLLACGHGPKLIGKVFNVTGGFYVDMENPTFSGTLATAVA